MNSQVGQLLEPRNSRKEVQTDCCLVNPVVRVSEQEETAERNRTNGYFVITPNTPAF